LCTSCCSWRLAGIGNYLPSLGGFWGTRFHRDSYQHQDAKMLLLFHFNFSLLLESVINKGILETLGKNIAK